MVILQVQQVNCMIPDIIICIEIHMPVEYVIHHLNYTVPSNAMDIIYTIGTKVKKNLYSTLHARGQGDRHRFSYYTTI
jgi:hypothetical protein